MTIEARIPSQNGVNWTPEMAATAIGKPFLDAPIDGEKIGDVIAACVVDGDLVMTISLGRGASVGFDLAAEEVECVSMEPRPPSLRTTA